ncbi:Alpha/Beta hydrolase protein [Lipomyces chichibuensis]|uniref:Alpha/Beta hydrolase protein n=1 Tax=Lipomyces chichibuensis TaxID=1546026 RepID=UPI003343E993
MRHLLPSTLLIAAVFAFHAFALQIPFLGNRLYSLEENTRTATAFKLRHVFHHGTGANATLHRRLDVPKSHAFEAGISEFYLSSVSKNVTRLSQRDPDFMESYLAYTRRPNSIKITDFDWIHERVRTPNISDPETLGTLARMTADAYVAVPASKDWVDVGEPYNETLGFGWDDKGVRGHVFADDENKTVVVAIKGTSSTLFDSDGDTVSNDKINDNLLFSCCCARISYIWTTVCDCYQKSYTCSQTCLEDALYAEDKYYRGLLDIYRNTTSLYPTATIWLTGHSLGGSMAALLGRTYGVPTVAFEAPPERLAAQRLHLPFPPVPANESTIWHIGNTADPIFMGVCNGPSSACWVGGYAMETQCHSGLECIYDTVKDKKWHVSVSSHRIRAVIDMIEAYNNTPPCVERSDCQDCFDWEFV